MLKKIAAALAIVMPGLGVQGAALAQNYPARAINLNIPLPPSAQY